MLNTCTELTMRYNNFFQWVFFFNFSYVKNQKLVVFHLHGVPNLEMGLYQPILRTDFLF